MEFTRKVLIVLIIIIFTYIILRLLHRRSKLINVSTKEGLNVFSTPEAELASVKSSNPVLIQGIKNEYTDRPLRDYVIKSSYNSAITGNYVNLDMIKYLLSRGCRFLDFEVFYIDNSPQVAYTTDSQYEIIDTDNSILLDAVLASAVANAFSSVSPNSGDPLFIHLRIKSNDPNIYKAVAKSIDFALKARLYNKQINKNTKLSEIMGQVVLIVDKTINRNYKDNNKGTFGGGNINFQKRTLNDKAFVLSLPQKKYGEEIQQGSVVVNIKRSGNFYSGNYTLVDDLYGNLYISNSIAGSPVSSSNVVGRFHFDQGYKYFAKGSITIEDNYTDGYWPMKATYRNVIFSNIKSPKEDLGACLYFTESNSSALIISPGPVANFNQSYNFENSNFSIFFTIKPEYPTVNYEFASLVAKEGPAEDLFIDINGNVGTSPAGTNYPYKVKLGVSGSNLGKLYFGRSSGFQTSEIDTGLTTLSAGTKYDIAVIKDGANMKIYVDGFLRASGTDTTTTGTYQAKECSNQANLYVGIQYNSGSAYNGYFDNLKFYNKALIQSELDYLKNTQGVGDVYVGNVFYKHGMIVITDPLVTESDILTTSCRGTQTIYETEVSCTIGGGEFNHSSNPTLQEYDPVSDEFIFRPFVSSSDFKPYITTIGLYDDRGNLLVIGKLGQPIKTPDNTDTTFIVRFDR